MSEIPIIPNIQRTKVGGAWVKTLSGILNFNHDVLSVQSLWRVVPSTWEPMQDSDLPFPWPANYVGWGQPFSAYTFAMNAIALSRLSVTEGLSCRIVAAIDYLIQQLLAYVDAQNRIFYSFNYSVNGNLFTAPWYSALSNSQAMQGLLELWNVTNNEYYLNLARMLRTKLLLVNGINTELTLVDNASWLWFEEYPAIGNVPTHVLNGHVISIFGLYRDRQLTGDTSLDNYIRAGIATSCRYYWQARVPGDIIRYWIYDNLVPDYGPLRAINFVDAMNIILPNPKLAELKDALFTDMRINS